MNKSESITSLLAQWETELMDALEQNNFLCMALFDVQGELLFANDAMRSLFKSDDPCQSLMNPSFDQLITLPEMDTKLVFEVFLTLGDYASVNASIWAQAYRKEGRLLILGGVNTSQLLEQNTTMHQLNREISNLQREMIREKNTLEKTLLQLNQANGELIRLNADKDRFISILAHDLRSPFTGLIRLTELLYENIQDYDHNKIKTFIQLIYESATDTYGLLEDLLTWARAQSGRIVFQPEVLDATELCRAVIRSMSTLAERKYISVLFEEQCPCFVWADSFMLKTILRNLLSNAIKFSPPNEQVCVVFERLGSQIRLSVKDHGVGMEAEVIQRLFDIAKKNTSIGTAGEKGTGLGLFLCKEFVEHHGASLHIDSTPGKGSSFSFCILVSKSPDQSIKITTG